MILFPDCPSAGEKFPSRIYRGFVVCPSCGQTVRLVRGHIERHIVPQPTLFDQDAEA